MCGQENHVKGFLATSLILHFYSCKHFKAEIKTRIVLITVYIFMLDCTASKISKRIYWQRPVEGDKYPVIHVLSALEEECS